MQRTFDVDNGVSGMLCFCGQMCKMSMLAPTTSAVRFWEVVCSTGQISSVHSITVISVSFVVEIKVSP